MRVPPPIQDPPSRTAWFVCSGLGLIVLALIAEFGTIPKPVVPASYAPGFLFLCVGTAIGMAVVDRFIPRFSSVLYFIPAVVILFVQLANHHSALPVLLYAGVFQLTRPVARAVSID